MAEENNMGRLEILLRARLGNFVPSGRRYLLDKKWRRKFGDMTVEMVECELYPLDFHLIEVVSTHPLHYLL